MKIILACLMLTLCGHAYADELSDAADECLLDHQNQEYINYSHHSPASRMMDPKPVPQRWKEGFADKCDKITRVHEAVKRQKAIEALTAKDNADAARLKALADKLGN